MIQVMNELMEFRNTFEFRLFFEVRTSLSSRNQKVIVEGMKRSSIWIKNLIKVQRAATRHVCVCVHAHVQLCLCARLKAPVIEAIKKKAKEH